MNLITLVRGFNPSIITKGTLVEVTDIRNNIYRCLVKETTPFRLVLTKIDGNEEGITLEEYEENESRFKFHI
jgi:hypothetical protein